MSIWNIQTMLFVFVQFVLYGYFIWEYLNKNTNFIENRTTERRSFDIKKAAFLIKLPSPILLLLLLE